MASAITALTIINVLFGINWHNRDSESQSTKPCMYSVQTLLLHVLTISVPSHYLFSPAYFVFFQFFLIIVLKDN